MTIRAGLRLVLLVLAAVFVLSDLWLMRQAERMDNLTDVMSDRLLPAAAISGAISTASSDLRIAELMHIGTTDAAVMTRFEAEMQKLRSKIDKLSNDYAAATAGDSAAAAALSEFRQTYQKYLAISDQMLPLSRQNRFDEAAGLAVQSTGLFNASSDRLDRMVAAAQNQARANSDEANVLYDEIRRLMTASIVLVLTVCFAAMWLAERRLGRPINEVAAAARALSEGRLGDTATDLTGRRDEIGDLARAVDQAAAAVRAATTTLGGAATAVASGDLSARADPAALRGDYAELAHGVNRLIEALSRPLREVAEVMRKVAAGDLEGRMTGVYEGDVRALKANLNRSLDTVVGVLNEVAEMAGGLAEGRLNYRLDGAYQGAFAEIKENVNDGLDSLRAAMAVIYVNITQVAAAATETAAAGNQVAALAADESAARKAVRDVADLADQAHLLALNAGISASSTAPGGEAGFRRVAGDIADLAERAADAARRLQGAGQRADGADSAAAAAQIGAAMGELAQMVEEIKVEIQRFSLA